MHLMDLLRDDAYRLAYPRLCGSDFFNKTIATQRVHACIGSALCRGNLCSNEQVRLVHRFMANQIVSIQV